MINIFDKILRVIVRVGLALLLVVACSDQLTKINKNPNAPINVPSKTLLPNAIESSASLISGLNLLKGLGWYVTQGTADVYTSSPYSNLFQSFRGAANNAWPDFYHILENLRIIKEMAIKNNNANKEAIATILMVYDFQVMTDLWGDIPYSEALQGNNKNGDDILTPTYDSQESIYDDLIKKLVSATDMIDVNGSSFGGNDVLYGGDMKKWLKFGNSLKLRLYMRLAEVNPSKARQGITKTYNNGHGMIFEDNSDNAEFNYGSYPYNNPINQDLRHRDDYRMSKTLIDTLKKLDDPRLRIYAIPTENHGDYKGAQNGVPASLNAARGDLSQLGAYFESPTWPATFMGYSEVRFILAEAAVRGWIPEDSKTMYNKAIRASMEAYSEERVAPVLSSLEGTRAYNFQKLKAEDFPIGITENEINHYLSQSEVQLDHSNWRQQIGLQKWIALFGQGVENWISLRRIGYPVLKMPKRSSYSKFPTRLLYPTKEQSLNKKNYQKAVSNQGEDDIITPLWWDMEVK